MRFLIVAAAVMLLAGDAATAHSISLKQQKATALGAIDARAMNAPGRGTIFSCNFARMGQALQRPWVDTRGVISFARKPVVPGAVAWLHELNVSVGSGSRTIVGNGLPAHATGTYPVPANSEAYRFDPNPNALRGQPLHYVIPVEPKIVAQPTCLPMGAIGIALTGALFFNALDAYARDAVANEVFDACEGHPEPRGRYHYHHHSPCLPQGSPSEHSPLVGYALDGFGIYGLRGEGGALLTNADLDECHGHVGPVPVAGGGTRVVYHYHLTEEFPYTLGCFRGEVDPRFLRRGPPPGGPKGPPKGPKGPPR